MMETIQEKRALRREIRGLVQDISPAARRQSDRQLFAQFLALPELLSAKTVLLFYGVEGEPETAQLFSTLFDQGKRVLLPRCLPDWQMEVREISPSSGFAVTSRGLFEPDEACPLREKAEVDLILVPNLCCDEAGFRLGQGGGYYDRYLQDYTGITVALCRQVLLQKKVPRQGHDRAVEIVLTEAHIRRFERQRAGE